MRVSLVLLEYLCHYFLKIKCLIVIYREKTPVDVAAGRMFYLENSTGQWQKAMVSLFRTTQCHISDGKATFLERPLSKFHQVF